MKMLLTVAVGIFFFTGCANLDAPYEKAKEKVQTGAIIYKYQPAKDERLEALYETLKAYDDLRKEIREK